MTVGEPAHRGPRSARRGQLEHISSPDPSPAGDRRPPSELTRRDSVTSIAMVAGVGAIAPFSFVRTTAPLTEELERYLLRKLVEANTPGIAVEVVRDDEIAWAAGVGWADRERRISHNAPHRVPARVSRQDRHLRRNHGARGGRADRSGRRHQHVPAVRGPHPPRPGRPDHDADPPEHASAIRDRWQVWGTPWSDRTLYFHDDSPISLGDFCHSYFVHGESRYRRRKTFYERAPGSSYAYSNLAPRWRGSLRRVRAASIFDQLCKAAHLRNPGDD
jgi:hypothetical protein